MNQSLLVGLVAGAAVATTVGAIGGYQMLSEPAGPAYAEVLAVEDVTRTRQTPREVCETVPVTRQAPVQDQNQILGTVAGAVVGGALGNQIGGGSGKKIATAAGAVAGGYAGKKTQERMQGNSTQTTMEQRCRTVQDSRTDVIGYDVRYRIGAEEGTVRMDRRPGERIPVRDGELVLDGSAPAG